MYPCHGCWSYDHFVANCPLKGKGKGGKGRIGGKGCTGGKGKGKGKGEIKCFNCGGDHLGRNCPKGKGKGGKGPCWICDQYGHIARDCPKGKGKGKTGGKGK